ncbi:CLUMA_CG016529, isoform A [Clunio marinus]|uniref:Kinase n=1 Tax=Clunio marinus TaxID=568069 RepID=A0A1J1IX94_9DIPT|nr:CLUMA_CG016529, isoform A [Clunio marinus]
MKLVEIIRTSDTSDETYKICLNFGEKLGKTCITCKDTFGFVVNRLIIPYTAEAMRMHERGDASIKDIDIAMKLGAGYPMGPFELSDLVGLDTFIRALAAFERCEPNNPLFKPVQLIQKYMSNLKLPPIQKPTQRRSYAGFPTAQASAANFANSFQLLVTAPSSSSSSTSSATPYNTSGETMANDKIPKGYVNMTHQVAGHTVHVGTDEIGLLKSIDDGSVLKPGGSQWCAAREIKFYEQLLTSTDPAVLPLKEFVPEYRGTQTLTIGNKTINFIKLQDLTHGMLEPCIIDIKIGRQTWDPLATDAKKEAEASKYQQCKTTVGFCIPGFQTYHLISNTYKKFGRDYGKKLNQNTVTDALKMFLNGDSGLNRQLVTSILTSLWAIQSWMRKQKNYRFYSTSILIVYDARKLRQVIESQRRQSPKSFPSALEVGNRKSGGASPTDLSPTGNNLNRTLSDDGDTLSELPKSLPKQVYKKIQRSRSSTNNYEQEMRNMRNNYHQMLDDLVGAYDGKKEWVFVKMIDFAHTFNTNELNETQANGLDLNYLDGIEHLCSIFEEFLKMCE